MSNRIHLPATELAGVYNSIEYYVKYRYEEIDIEDLKVIRRLLKKIEADYYLEYKTSDPEEFGGLRKRKVGRQSEYTEENEKAIVDLYQKGYTLKKIAEETSSTIGRVNAVVRKTKSSFRKIDGDDRFWDILDSWIEGEEKRKQDVGSN